MKMKKTRAFLLSGIVTALLLASGGQIFAETTPVTKFRLSIPGGRKYLEESDEEQASTTVGVSTDLDVHYAETRYILESEGFNPTQVQKFITGTRAINKKDSLKSVVPIE